MKQNEKPRTPNSSRENFLEMKFVKTHVTKLVSQFVCIRKILQFLPKSEAHHNYLNYSQKDDEENQ